MDDYISRADAIAYIDRVTNSGIGRNKSLDYIHKYISSLPSANYITEKTNDAIKTSNDVIYRADAIEAVCRDCTLERKDKCKAEGYCYEVKNLKALPSADAVQGEWLYRWNEVECSVCGEFAKDKSNYCPMCGARMKGGEDE